MDGLVRSLDEDSLAAMAAAESMVEAVSSIAGLLISQCHFNEASRLWLHALGFIPFLQHRGSDCNVGSVLQQAHNVFEAAAAVSASQPTVELEFDSTLLAGALQTIIDADHISASSGDEENSGMVLNLLPELQPSTSGVAVSRKPVVVKQARSRFRSTTLDRTLLPLPAGNITIRKSARARSRVPLPLALQEEVGSDTDFQHIVQDEHMVPESAGPATDKPLSLRIDTGNRLWSPVPDVSPDWRASTQAESERWGGQTFAPASAPHTPEFAPTGITARYDEYSSEEPSSPTFCPFTHLSQHDATPQLWGVPMMPAAMTCDPVFEDSSEQIESPVCNMARASTTSVEAGLFSDHIMDGVSLISRFHESVHGYEPIVSFAVTSDNRGSRVSAGGGSTSDTFSQHTQPFGHCQARQSHERSAEASVPCFQVTCKQVCSSYAPLTGWHASIASK